MAVPLDKKHVTVESAGKSQAFPALHPKWVEDIAFTRYVAPPIGTDAADLEEWSERLDFIFDDLHILLGKKHDKFWSQVVFDETLHRCLDTFLKNSPRSHDVIFSLPSELQEKHNRLSRQYFMVFLRLATHKESKDDFFTPNVYGDIIYENFIFDIPKIMDLCVLYGGSNGPLLTKMIGNIFMQQPNYYEDLKQVMPTVLEIFETMLERCGIKTSSRDCSPRKLHDTNHSSENLLHMSIAKLQDFVFYMCDTFQTLWSFFEIFPNGTSYFSDKEFTQRLVYLYENLVPKISEAFRKRSWNSMSLRQLLRRKVHQSQASMLQLFRAILFHSFLQPLLDEGSSEMKAEECVEGYLDTMSSLLSERRFIGHMQHLFPFNDDLDLLSQAKCQLDDMRVNFIREGVLEAFSVFGPKEHVEKMLQDYDDTSSSSEDEIREADSCAGAASAASQEEHLGASKRAVRKSAIEMESLVCSVSDILPDQDPLFLRMCLEELDYNVEQVIHAILEDKLPFSHDDFEKQKPRLQREMEQPDIEEETVLSQRRNIYDGDEFDIVRNDHFDYDKIHRGKKEKAVDLNDKEPLKDFKELYSRYGNQYVESMYDKVVVYEDEYEDGRAIDNMYNKQNVYDDEYDDTYDSNLIGAKDADSADELATKRLASRPMGATGRNYHGEQSEDSSEDDSEKKKDHFIEDPAKVRERAAARYASKMARTRKPQQPQRVPTQSAANGPPKRQYDVKGKPKGQGQEETVVRNRAWKEKHKSSRVNHNRRVLADKKRKF